MIDKKSVVKRELSAIKSLIEKQSKIENKIINKHSFI